MIGTPMASKDIIYHFASVHTNCSQGALLCNYSGVQQHWSKLGSVQVEQEYVCHQYFSNAKQSFLMVMLSIDRANTQYLTFYGDLVLNKGGLSPK